jgi:hypothetical protein
MRSALQLFIQDMNNEFKSATVFFHLAIVNMILQSLSKYGPAATCGGKKASQPG